MIIELSGPGVSLTQADLQGGITLTRSVNVGDNVTLGSCVADKLEFSTLDLDAQSLKHYAGTEFSVSVHDLEPYTFTNGDLLIFKDGDRYYFPANHRKLGLFTAQKPERVNETKWKFVCYDRMVLFDKLVDDWYNSLTYPISLKNMLLGLCKYCGVQLKTQNFTNSDFMVRKNVAVSDTKGRDVLSWIAELAACFCKIDIDGKLVLDFYKSKGVVITKTISNRIADYDVQRVDKLQIKAKEDDIGVIVGTGTNAYVIQGNPLLFTNSDEEIRPAAEKIFAKISNLSYTPLEVDLYEKDGVCDAGDIVQLSTLRGTYTAIVTSSITNGTKNSVISVGAENRSKLQSVNRRIQQLRGKANEIVADVEQLSVKLSDVEAGTEAQFLVMADQISAEVTRATGAEGSLRSSIVVQADRISAEVTRATGAEGQLNSSIIMQADQIAMKVSQTDYNGNTIASLINQTATTILLQASKINLNGYVTINSLSNGQTTVDGSNIKTGTISASRLSTDVLTVDNIYAKNLNLTGYFKNAGYSSTIRMENGELIFNSSGFSGERCNIWYSSSNASMNIDAGYTSSISTSLNLSSYYDIYMRTKSGNIFISPSSGRSVYIGSSTTNLEDIHADRYYQGSYAGYTGEISYMKSATSSGRITVRGGIITSVS